MTRIAAIALTLAPAFALPARAHEAAAPHVHTDLGVIVEPSPALAITAGLAAVAVALGIAMRRGAGR
jgi:hypothetical protein